MSRLNEEDLNERRDIHGNNNNLEMYSEDEKNNDIYYLKCRNCLQSRRMSCLHLQEDKACLRFASTFPKLGILLVLMCLMSLGSASTISNSSTYSTTSTTTSAPESRGRWCQILLNEKKTKEVTETKLCSETYNSSCGFFTFTTCLFTRYKICTRIYNHTYLAYKTVMDCCPGWARKDNDTCVELARKSKPLPSIHELSMGTFAAMCSASSFVMVIVFFIVKAVWKKKRKEKAAAENIHMEQLDSLDAPQPQQQVPLIPPQQPMMANPHSLIPPHSHAPDDHDLVAAGACAPVAAPPAFVSARSYSFGESDALCPKADHDPDLEANAVDATTAATTAAPAEDHQEQVGMKLLQKIPEPEDTGATAATIPSESTENVGLPDDSELQIELFIREDGDVPDTSKPESQTQLQTQTLPDNSKNDSQGSQLDPKI